MSAKTGAALAAVDADFASSRPALGDVLRANEKLREDLREARAERAELTRVLAAALVGSEADRELRKAALNLMEDAIAARVAEQREADVRRRAEDELRAADRRKDEFLATLAHELRGPLAPVRNSLNALKLGGLDAAGVRRAYELMDRQIQHMIRLVDDLMEVSRITRGHVELRRQRVALARVVEGAIESCEPLISAGEHTLEVSLPADALTLDADPVRITQVISNLLSNAAKYTDRGGRIGVRAAREGEEVVISVEDTGAGIPADMLPRIFDLFAQADRTYDRSQGGLGIGLTLVRSLVELHGGSVEGHSAGADRGSQFVVRLPLAAPGPAPDAVRKPVASRTAGPRRILVVDDNPDSAETLGVLLELQGDQVQIRNDGESALEAFRSFEPSVVFLDIGMPRMDGHEVARRMRQLPTGGNATLVALTGWGQPEDRKNSKAAGFDHHLVKPVALDVLEELLASLPS